MKKTILTVIVLGVFAIGSSGCSKSPKDVCKKMFELAKKDAKDSKKEMPKDAMEKAMKKCVEKMEKAKKEDPKAFKCAASCIMDLEKFSEFKTCTKKCKPKKK